MANSAQARKRARQASAQRDSNMSQRSELRTAIKKVRKAIEAGDKAAAQQVFQTSVSVIDSIADKEKAAAQQVFQTSVSVIDSIADKEIVHKNKAARHKSRLSLAVKNMA